MKVFFFSLTTGNVPLSGVELARLQEELQASTAAAFAQGTDRNLKIQWESFLLFCCYFNFVYLPASTQTIQLYA